MSKVLTAFFLTTLTGMLLAAPVINSLSLRSGTNLPRYNSEVVRAIYDLANPDDTAAARGFQRRRLILSELYASSPCQHHWLYSSNIFRNREI